MARITVEDCLKRVSNHFELVRIAAKRAKQIAKGGLALVDLENDKPTVLALREIAAGVLPKEETIIEPSSEEGGTLSTSE